MPLAYSGSEPSTKLKLLGVDVASFGSTLGRWFKRQFDDGKGKERGFANTIQIDHFSGLYRKLTFGANMKPMGGLIVSNAEDHYSLLNLRGQADLGKKTLGDLFMGGSGEENAEDLSDDSVACLCQKVTMA